MNSRLVVFPYKMGNSYSKEIAKVFNTFRVFPNGKYVPKDNDLILNWGNSRFPTWKATHWLNTPEAVGRAVNKLAAFCELRFAGINVPDFLIEKEKAQEWLEDGHTVLARHKVSSFGGKGIEVITAENKNDLPDVPLYVKYKKKRKEFRVTVFNKKVIFVSQKKKKKDSIDADPYIRSHSNGWIFAHKNIEEPTQLRDIAVQAINALGLDFGGVDIIWNETENKCYVLEVNTAPGIEGNTFSAFCTALKEFLDD